MVLKRGVLLPAVVCILGCSLFVLDRVLKGIIGNNSMSTITGSSRSSMRNGFSTRSTHSYPARQAIEEGTIIAVINTPKSGTGSIQGSFIYSIGCPNGTGKRDDIPRVVLTIDGGCTHNTEVIRTHYADSGADAIASFRQSNQNRKCIVATAIRDPKTWLPSLFMQERNKALCDRVMSYDEYHSDYITWMTTRANEIRDTMLQVRPKLFQEFGTTLTEEMNNVRANGGYSIVPNNNNNNDNGPFANCELLFLKMEDRDSWPDIFANLYPGIKYEPNQKRVDMCPKIADHYTKIMGHDFTTDEKVALIGGSGDIAEYFNLYGM